MLGVAQLKLVASFVTTAIQVYAFTSALEKMSQRTVHTEELKFNRTEAIRLAEKEERREEALRREAIRLAEKEERREEALRRESREDRKTFEDRILLISAAVLACVVYKYM